MIKKIFRYLLFAIGSIIAGIATFILLIFIIFNAAVPYNNYLLNSFSKQLYNCELPEGTVIIEKHKVCGNFSGTGDQIDFLACILIKSDKTMDELEEYFETLHFESAKPSHERIIPEFVSVAENELKVKGLYALKIIFNKDIDFSEGNYYAIVIYDGGYSAWFDMRGA